MWQNDTPSEQWRQAVGYEGIYQVSDRGRVRKETGELAGQWSNTGGYVWVRLSRPRRLLRVHRLVAAAFVPNPGRKPSVNHIDNNPSNNCAWNLEWCTQRENLQHARRQGRMPNNHRKGKRSPNASLSDGAVATIRAEYAAGGISWAALGTRHGLSKRSVGRIVRGESYV